MAQEDWKTPCQLRGRAQVKLGYRDRLAFADVSGVTARTLGKLEKGLKVGAVTLADVEIALGWEPDSARSILAGASRDQGSACLAPQIPNSPRTSAAVLAYLEVRRAGG